MILDLTRTPCFNIDDFVECVEDITKVTHVVDLLQVNLNNDECKYVFKIPLNTNNKSYQYIVTVLRNKDVEGMGQRELGKGYANFVKEISALILTCNVLYPSPHVLCGITYRYIIYVRRHVSYVRRHVSYVWRP